MKDFSSRTPDWVVFTLLSVSSDPENHESLRQAVTETRFRVRCAATCAEAVEQAGKLKPAVITCEQTLSDGTWRDLLQLLAALPEPPPVVVIAHNADEWLWAEVLNHGGYDVVERPLQRKEMARVLGSACGIGYLAVTA